VSATPNARLAREPDNAVARLVLQDPNVISNAHEDDDAFVMAVRSHLLVHPQATLQRDDLHGELEKVAKLVATVASADGARSVGADRQEQVADDQAQSRQIQVWRLDDPDKSPFEEARRLRDVGGTVQLARADGRTHEVPSVTPNHIAIVSGSRGSGCPAGPPRASHHPPNPFIEPYDDDDPHPHVAVLDTGYIYMDPPHGRLDERITSVKGLWLDSSVDPAVWKPNPPDKITTDHQGRLIGIVGHGTFVAGLVAHVCPEAAITVVGHRDAEVPVGKGENQYRLWASEISLANSLWRFREADVIQCGFAFPTLDDLLSMPFAHTMQDVIARRPGIAVVSPAGNEESTRRYWPAALPDVIGVAATKHDGRHPARFSNWGPWCDCCAIGADVRSTYIRWTGRVEDEDPNEIEHFEGWARWQGTSFAAPKVSGAIARQLTRHPDWTPRQAYEKLIAGETHVPVRPVTSELWPEGWTLPELVVH
jgi:subtilisin family serine protease